MRFWIFFSVFFFMLSLPMSGEEYFLLVFSETVPRLSLFQKPLEPRNKEYLWVIPYESLHQQEFRAVPISPLVLDWQDEYSESGETAYYWIDMINYPVVLQNNSLYKKIHNNRTRIQSFSFSKDITRKKTTVNVYIVKIIGDLKKIVSSYDNRMIYYGNLFSVCEPLDSGDPVLKLLSGLNLMQVPYYSCGMDPYLFVDYQNDTK